MPGTNAGTGRPISFQCWKCRRKKGRLLEGRVRDILGHKGRANRVWLTGNKRDNGNGNAGCGNDIFDREYICDDCGHQGWSRHIELARKEERESRE